MKYQWCRWGDLNAFFGLMLDNVAVLVLLVGMLAHGPVHFTPQFVIGRMVPGSALGVLIGDLVYTYLAFRLAKRTGRTDVTAMPLGLDTPSTFAVGPLVLLPALGDWLVKHPGDQDTAMYFAWHVGAILLVLVGLFKTICAPWGSAVRRWVPRAGLLGSLAAVALALIAFLPLLFDIAAVPLVGFLALAVILVTLIARKSLPGKVPGALAAVGAGVLVYFVLKAGGEMFNVALVPPLEQMGKDTGPLPAAPDMIWHFDWWIEVLWYALGKLPIMLPFALATVVGGIDCTESAAAVGDEYDTRTIILTEGLASVFAGLFGGVIQNTPYIGQPAYKVMDGRAAYTLATGLFIGAAGFFGWFTYLFDFLPRAAMFPILVFVGLEITAHSYQATPVKHYPALAFAALPALAQLALIPLNIALGTLAANKGDIGPAEALPMVQTLRCLGNGFIVTSLLWGAALAALLDDRARRSATYLLVAAGFSLFGIIHSPFAETRIAWPWDVMTTLPTSAQYQSPYHWAAAYVLAALVIALFSRDAKRSADPEAPVET